MNDYKNSTEENENTVDLMRFVRAMWKYRWLIVLTAILAALLVLGKSIFFTADTYTSRGQLYVSNKTNTYSTAMSTSMQMNDIESARKMSETSVRILKTNDFLDIVSAGIAEKTGKNYSASYIGSHVSILADDTEILTVNVTATSPEAAFEIADGFLSCAPTHLKDIFNSGDAIIVDTPRLNLVPNSKHIPRSLIVALFAGAVIGALIVFVITLFDKKVHSGADASKRYDLPLLGEIPR